MRTDTLLRRDGRRIALDVCAGPVERARGLLGRPAPPPGVALWITPCSAVHTCGMRYPIDVAFVDERGLVVRVVPDCPPWRAAADRRAASALEMRAGESARLGLRAGERLFLPTLARKPAVREESISPERALRLVAIAAVVATLWILGGCAITRVPPDAAGMPDPLGELALQAAIEYDSREWRAAERAYRQLADQAPAHAEHWYRLGITRLHLAQPDEAATALGRALVLEPESGRSAEALAVARLAQARASLLAAADRPAPVRAARGGPVPASDPAPAARLARTVAALERLLPIELLRLPPAPAPHVPGPAR
jgi:uncharacterized membrane protein (UPF0127 family)